MFDFPGFKTYIGANVMQHSGHPQLMCMCCIFLVAHFLLTRVPHMPMWYSWMHCPTGAYKWQSKWCVKEHGQTACKMYHTFTGHLKFYSKYIFSCLLYIEKCVELICFENMCSVGSTSTFPLLVVLLLLMIMMRGNHVPIVGSLGRHY